MRTNKHFKNVAILLVLSYFVFMFGNGIISLSLPDEVFYAQTAKEMAQQNTWMTPMMFGQPQFEKPVLTYWLLRIGFMMFGLTSFAARFFPALFGMLGVVAVYFLGFLGFKEDKKAFISALVLMTCALYLGLARTVFTDLFFSVFILFALLSFYWGYLHRERKAAGLILFFIFSGLAVLTKGPLGILITLLTAGLFLFIKRDLKFLLSKYFFWGLFVFMAVTIPWYWLMVKLYGNVFIKEFFYNCHIRRIFEAEHKGNDRWYFYPFSMLGCIFPWNLFLIGALFSIPKYLKEKDNAFYVFLFCLIAAVLATFQFAHSKLVSYIFPLFPALALLAGGFIGDSLAEDKLGRLFTIVSVASIGFILLIPLALAVGVIGYPDYLSAYAPAEVIRSIFIPTFLVLGVITLMVAFKTRLRKCVYCFAVVLPVTLYLFPFISEDIEPYLSAKQTAEYLLSNYDIKNSILASKFFARGVKYYTDKEVAVVDMPGTQFFSPHPVPFLNTPDKVRDFLRRQGVTYCVLKKNNLQDINGLAGKEFKAALLKVIGNEYIVKIETVSK